jgi:phosphoribosylamine--glycine ligase
MEEGERALADLGGRVVVKADGLAAGKGVIVCSTVDEARAALVEMLVDKRFGSASDAVLVEERLEGREVSVMAITDGKQYRLLETAEDHKAIYDGDRGPNTGGMGAVSPAPWVTSELLDRVREEIFDRTMAGLAADGIDYRGVLYAGLMVGDDGVPMMLEYNCRFGDPETQAVLPRLESDLGAVLLAAACGELGDVELSWDSRVSVCVVAAAQGYPGTAKTGDAIVGLDDIEEQVFHAGTRRDGDVLVTSGGRVLSVMALADSVERGRKAAYAAIEKIRAPELQFRSDIGKRGA